MSTTRTLSPYCNSICKSQNLRRILGTEFTKTAGGDSLLEQLSIRSMILLLKSEGNCSHLRAKPAHFVRHLPPAHVVDLVIDLNVRRNQPQCSNVALNIRTRQSHCGSYRSTGGRCRGTNGNSFYIFSAEKCTFIIKYSKVWKWCRTFSANFFDLNVRHLTCLRSFCVEHSGQLPACRQRKAGNVSHLNSPSVEEAGSLPPN